MPMPPYPVMCYAPGCANEAAYKVAARWSDGITYELKTYSLACEGCLSNLFRAAKQKRDRCRLAAGESLDEPAIFCLARGERDRELVRCTELESALTKAT